MPQVYIPKAAYDKFTDEYGSDADEEIQKVVRNAASEAGE